MKYFLSIAICTLIGWGISSYVVQGVGGIQHGEKDISNQFILIVTVVGAGVGVGYATKI